MKNRTVIKHEYKLLKQIARCAIGFKEESNDNNKREAELWKIKLFNDWDNIVGNLGTKVCIEKIDGDTLVLSVENSSSKPRHRSTYHPP